jgi:hypothetical protein
MPAASGRGGSSRWMSIISPGRRGRGGGGRRRSQRTSAAVRALRDEADRYRLWPGWAMFAQRLLVTNVQARFVEPGRHQGASVRGSRSDTAGLALSRADGGLRRHSVGAGG